MLVILHYRLLVVVELNLCAIDDTNGMIKNALNLLVWIVDGEEPFVDVAAFYLLIIIGFLSYLLKVWPVFLLKTFNWALDGEWNVR